MHLYLHQRQAVDKLRSGSILCGGVGTGKSLTALAYFFEKEGGGRIEPDFAPMKRPKSLFIITTARKRDTHEWEHELIPFRLGNESPISPPVVIDSWNNIKKYKDVRDAFFIFDEQRVVGKGQWVQSFLRIASQNHWILLSATPGDTWTDYIPVFIANGYYRNRTDFVRQHVIYSNFSKYPKVERYINEGILDKYRRDILVTMEFQKHTETIHRSLWADFDKELTKRVMKERWDIYADEPIQDAGGLCRILRRISNSDPSRLAMVLDIYERHHRAILFYNFDYELEALRQLLSGAGICYAEWNGHRHEPLPTGNRWVYLVQYTAGSEGWNCTSTDTTIFFSQSYSYKTTVQAAGRTDRLNTPYTQLYFYHIRSRSPIDLAILKALNQKRDFNESGFV